MTGRQAAGRASWVDQAVRRESDDAASKAGVEIREMQDVAEMAQGESLFERIWGPGGFNVPLLRGLVLTGNYAVGAWSHEHLMAAAVAFRSAEPGSIHLHVLGVAPTAQGSGIGFAVIHHLRAWAAERGLDEITWTFDPVVRRNGWFALVKLGARAEGYHPDFFGYLNDPINRWDYTDRCVARWDLPTSTLEGPGPEDRAPEEPGALAILTEDQDGRPVVADPGWIDRPPATLLCQTPADAGELRRGDPKVAREWLSALRGTMARAMEAGYVATGMTSDGRYVLRAPG